MLKSYLDFEQPIADLEQQVIDLNDSDLDDMSFATYMAHHLGEPLQLTSEKIRVPDGRSETK